MQKLCLNIRITTVLLLIVSSDCLRCWHCIADNCVDDPSDNYKASEKLCRYGQFCQKVYFEMVEETGEGNVIHKSTVRGCSTDCIERNDFLNCTEQLKNSRGCVRKHCCDDGDLCNSASDLPTFVQSLFYTVILSTCLFS